VALRFELTAAGQPPASALLAALHEEYDALAGRALTGGPSAEPGDFAPPAGAFLVAYDGDQPVACGGVKTIAPGVAEIKRLYVALERHAAAMGMHAARLDSQRHTWAIYAAAGYREIPDYNGNPHAHVWGEKTLTQPLELRRAGTRGG
jgi:hypothetical protein